MKVYLDTSVPSTYFDSRTPERQRATIDFWSRSLENDMELCISSIVLTEIQRTPSLEKRNKMLGLVEPLTNIPIGPEVSEIASRIIKANLVPENKIEDAEHLALAALHFVDVVVSWNFRHMVNLKIKQKLPLILAENGCFKKFEIISPFEYLGE